MKQFRPGLNLRASRVGPPLQQPSLDRAVGTIQSDVRCEVTNAEKPDVGWKRTSVLVLVKCPQVGTLKIPDVRAALCFRSKRPDYFVPPVQSVLQSSERVCCLLLSLCGGWNGSTGKTPPGRADQEHWAFSPITALVFRQKGRTVKEN